MSHYLYPIPCPSDPRDIAARYPAPSPALPAGLRPDEVGQFFVPVEPTYRAHFERSARHGALSIADLVDPDALYDVTFESDQDHIDAVTDAVLYYIPSTLLSQYCREAGRGDCHLCYRGATWVSASWPGMVVACQESEHVTASEHPDLVPLAAAANATLRDLLEQFGSEHILDAVLHFASSVIPQAVLASVQDVADGMRPIYGEYDPMDF